VHAVKSVVIRPTVSAATAGVGNVPVSIAEDVTSTIVSILAVVVPVVMAAIIILITSWIVYKLYLRVKLKEQAR
jgi:hypothetical protein